MLSYCIMPLVTFLAMAAPLHAQSNPRQIGESCSLTLNDCDWTENLTCARFLSAPNRPVCIKDLSSLYEGTLCRTDEDCEENQECRDYSGPVRFCANKAKLGKKGDACTVIRSDHSCLNGLFCRTRPRRSMGLGVCV